MKKPLFTIIIFTALGLSGCMASTQSYVHNQYKQAANMEMAAWENAKQESDTKCGKYDDDNPMPRKEAVKIGNCFAEIVREKVLPNAINPHALSAYLIETQSINVEYKQGKIDRDEANLKVQQTWHNYWSGIEQQYNSSMQQAYNADVQAAQQRQQALQSFNQQIQQQQAINAQRTNDMMQQMQMPKRTTCTGSPALGGSVNCTTW